MKPVSINLGNVYEETMVCKKCRLAYSRTNVVFGCGNEKSRVLFLGEAPGYYEDQQGEPFVGAAGKLLNELLNNIGMKREDVYITNVVKCRPPQNRDPAEDEIETCRPYLLSQLEIISPRVISTLGNYATQVILEKKVPITSVRGKAVQVGSRFVFPLYHPAAALHRRDMLEPLQEDFQKLKDFLASDIEPEPEPEQLELL